MKGSLKFALCVVLSIFLLLSCSFLFLNAEAEVSLEKIKLGDNLIRIQTGQQNPIIDVELLENTDSCFTDCHAILKIHPYQDITLPSEPNSEFAWKFLKEKPWMDGLVSHHFEILETTEYKVEVPEYGTVLVNTTCYNEDEGNKSYECEVEQSIQTGSHEETRYKHENKPFEFWGQTLKANKDYTIKLVGKKRPQLGANNIDWIPTIKGFELKEWEWWNSSWSYRTNITITENLNIVDLTDYQVKISLNTSALISAGKMNPDCSDMRWVNSTNDEIYFFIENESCDSASNTTIWVRVPKIPQGSTEVVAVYYGNNTPVSSSSYEDGKNVFVAFDDFEYSDSISNHGWTINSGSPVTSTGSYKTGSRSLTETSTWQADLDFAFEDSSPILLDIRWWGRKDSEGQMWENWIYRDGTTDYVIISTFRDTGWFAYYTSEYLNLYDVAASTWYDIRYLANLTSDKYQIWIDDDLKLDWTNFALGRTTNNITTFNIRGGSSTVSWMDYIRIYKNATAGEPTWSISEGEMLCPLDNTYISENTKLETFNSTCNVEDEGSNGVLIINAPNIILDCDGITLNGTGSGVGIYNRGFHNITLNNCKVQNYESDIKFENDLITDIKNSASFYE